MSWPLSEKVVIFCHAQSASGGTEIVSLGAATPMTNGPRATFHRFVYPTVAIDHEHVNTHGVTKHNGNVFFCGKIINDKVFEARMALNDFLDFIDSQRNFKRQPVCLVSFDDSSGPPFGQILSQNLVDHRLSRNLGSNYLKSISIKDLNGLSRNIFPRFHDLSLNTLYKYYFYCPRPSPSTALEVAMDTVEVSTAMAEHTKFSLHELISKTEAILLFDGVAHLENHQGILLNQFLKNRWRR